MEKQNRAGRRTVHRAWKMTAAALLALGTTALSGCVVEPRPNYGEAYYARPAPVYVAPRYGYGPRWGSWHRHGWRGDAWHGGGHHGH